MKKIYALFPVLTLGLLSLSGCGVIQTSSATTSSQVVSSQATSSSIITSSIEGGVKSHTGVPFFDWFIDLWDSLVSIITQGKFPENNSVANSVLGRVLIAIIIGIIFYIFIKLFLLLLRKITGSRKRSQSFNTTKTFMLSVVKVFLYVIMVLVIGGILGFNFSNLSTIISSGIVAIGLSLQNIISNFASGIIILTQKKILAGDYIVVNNGQGEGTVKEIGILSTQLITVDNLVVFVPNSIMTSGVVKNSSIMKYRRINLIISVDYSTDIDEAKKIIRGVIDNSKYVNHEMSKNIIIDSFGDSSINFSARCYAASSVYWDAKWELEELIFKEFKKRGVEIPFNQMDVHIDTKNEKKVYKHADLSGLENVKLTNPNKLLNTDYSRYDEALDKEMNYISEVLKPKTKEEIKAEKEKNKALREKKKALKEKAKKEQKEKRESSKKK